jgi:hypothetical protein
MITSWHVQQKLLGLHRLVTEEERFMFFGNIWSLFVKGVTAP